MSASSYNSLVPYINLEVDGAPLPVVTAMINLAARELCLISSCWFEWEEIPLEDGVDTYTVTSPSGAATVRSVKYILLGKKALIPEAESTVLEYKRHLIDLSGEPEVFYMLNDLSIKVLPKPTSSDVGKIMRVKSAFVPALEATSIPREFIDRYSETLIAGAKYKLMEMPGKPWSNPNLAMLHRSTFETGVTKARIDVEMSYSPANMRVTKRKFGQA